MKGLKKDSKLATFEKPYGKKGNEIWSLPVDQKATGTFLATILAEIDDGYLVTPVRISNIAAPPLGGQSVNIIFKSRVQDD